MNIDVTVKNLGQIKEATFNIRPMTVITGPNGTGKSFFTKSLYSILNVINKNVYHESVRSAIRQLQLQIDVLAGNIKYLGLADFETAETTKLDLEHLQAEFDDASTWKIDEYLAFAVTKAAPLEEIYGRYVTYLTSLKPTKRDSIEGISESIKGNFKSLILQLKSPDKHYSHFFASHIENELKDNFQISSLTELISFGEKTIEIKADELLTIGFDSKDGIFFNLGSEFIDEVSKLSSVVFFESPAYWKVRDALNWAKNNPKQPLLISKKKNDTLTGVPKYFYDLDDALKLKTKSPSVFKSATELLGYTIGGEFVFKGGSLSFFDKTGREVSKNLVSFGMTNLGMIQALLKHNVITEGSFVFIDEPETNLHPDWQVKLSQVLLELSGSGVNVVVNTHSSDFVKALEVKVNKLQIEKLDEFLAVHFVDNDGKLLEFESDDCLQRLIETRELLSLPYQELYFSGL